MSDITAKAAEIKHTGVARVLVEYLQHKHSEALRNMADTKDIILLRQLQGRAHELTELINFFKDK